MSRNCQANTLLLLILAFLASIAAAAPASMPSAEKKLKQDKTQGEKTSDLLSDAHPMPVNDRILSLLKQSKTDAEQARQVLNKIEAISDNFNRAERYLMHIINALLIPEGSDRAQRVIDKLNRAMALEDKIAKTQLFTPEFSQVHLLLAEQYAAMQDYEKAYKQKELYLKKYYDYRKQIREARLAKLNEKYETDLKLKENELLKSQHELKALQIKEAEKKKFAQHRNMYILLITAIIFLLILIRQFRVRSILRSLSKTDSLTGLYNRRTLFAQGDALIDKACDDNTAISVIMLDIDHFKQINDNFGHDVGDKVITNVALLGKEVIRTRDVFARLGGEEFAVILPNTQLDEAKAIAEHFREKVEQNPLSELTQTVTISAGVACNQATKAEFDDLLHAADQAMYQAKKSGRNQVCCYQGQQS